MNNYISPPYCLAEMYDGHAACYPLMSHGEYADVTDRQTDRQRDRWTVRCQTVTLHFPLWSQQVYKELWQLVIRQ